MRHFRAIVEQGITPVCGLAEGVASLKVALAAIEAAHVAAPLTFEARERNEAARQLPRSEAGDG
jgi:hypothetical protein